MKLYVGLSKYGKGVFAKKNIRDGETILIFRGNILSFEEAKINRAYCLQIGIDKYYGPSGWVDDYVNHSCQPNAGLKNARTLIALQNIQKNEEITFDYSTCLHENNWTMECKCDSLHCRGMIGDFRYIPQLVQKKYLQMGVVPKWILDAMNYDLKAKSI